MLVEIRENINLIHISVILFWVEYHQSHKHGQQSYLGEIYDKCDKMANIYWLIKRGKTNIPNQLFHHSPWKCFVKGKVEACFDKERVYGHIYGNIESVTY